MKSFALAYQYYSRYDVGPILVEMLIDIADLYLSSFLHEEEIFKGLCARRETSLRMSTELTSQLLGGALLSLLDSRFAFTDVVIERYRDKMMKLSQQVARRMCTILLKILYHGSFDFEGKDKEEPLVKAIYLDMMRVASGDDSSIDRTGCSRLYEMLEALCKCKLGRSLLNQET